MNPLDILAPEAAPAIEAVTFIEKHWKLIVSGIALAIVAVMLHLARADAAKWKRQDDADKAALHDEQLDHAVTRASLNGALVVIAAKNAESDARAAALKSAQAANAETTAALDARQHDDRGRGATLTELARTLPANAACVAPAALTSNLKGL